MQDLMQLMCARRSCRKYKPDPVPQELLEQVVDAGRIAPSGKAVQRNHFIVIRTPKLLEEVRALVERELAALDPEAPEHQDSRSAILAARKGNNRFFYDAPALILVANQKGSYNFFADAACALQNMMLMATELGLGSCWINQFRRVADPPSLRALLGLPEGEELCAGLALGYPVQQTEPNQVGPGNLVDYLD